MYNGVNDENNESSFNSDENLYHYSYSKDQAHHAEQKTPFSYFPKTRIFLQTDGSRI